MKAKHVVAHIKTPEEIQRLCAADWMQRREDVAEAQLAHDDAAARLQAAKREFEQSEANLRRQCTVNSEVDKRVIPVKDGFVLLEWMGGRTNVEFIAADGRTRKPGKGKKPAVGVDYGEDDDE